MHFIKDDDRDPIIIYNEKFLYKGFNHIPWTVHLLNFVWSLKSGRKSFVYTTVPLTIVKIVIGVHYFDLVPIFSFDKCTFYDFW